jgi:signal recognition particle subunit SRP54
VVEGDREEEALRMLQGQFTFKDFYDQLSMIQKMGPLKEILAKMPIQGMLPKDINVDDRELVKIKAMIDSMTAAERVNPKLFNESRARRVAKGSGRQPKEVLDLLKKFMTMRQMMGSIGKNLGFLGKIPGMGGLAQMNNMRKMAAQMGGGGMGGLGGMGMPGMGMGMPGLDFGAGGTRKPVDRDKLKKARKDAKKARKKNRKK